jgi:hypothetical protein
MSCCRRSRVVDFAVADCDVAVVKVVMVDGEFVIFGVPAIAGGAKIFFLRDVYDGAAIV